MARTKRPAEAVPPAKREAVLAAAREVFLESGYAAASMDAVAARAGVSKATIYAHFSGKTALFGAVIADRCEQAFGAIDLGRLDGAPAAEGLRQVAWRLLDLLLAPEAIAMYRVIIAEAPRQPELGLTFHAAGPAAGTAALARYLADLDRRGALRVPDPRLAAETFLGMLKGDLYLRRLLGLDDGDRTPEQVVSEAVRAMLATYAPRQSAAPQM